MLNEKKKILFYPVNQTAFVRFLIIGRKLKQLGHRPIFLVTSKSLQDNLLAYKEYGLDTVCLDKAYPQVIDKPNRKIKISTKTILNNEKTLSFAWLKNIFLLKNIKEKIYFYKKQGQLRIDYAKKKSMILEIFDQVMPDSVVVYGDRNLGYEPVLIRCALDKKIPVYVPTTPAIASIDDTARFRLVKDHAYDCTTKKKLIKKFPNQFHLYEGRYVSFYPWWSIEVLSESRLLSPNPWIVGSVDGLNVMLSGQHAIDRYKKMKVCNNLIVTGDPEFDTLYRNLSDENLKKQLIRYYDLDVDKKTIVVAMPYPHLYAQDEATLERYSDVTDHICSVLALLDANCLVSLHPKTNEEQHKYFESKPEISIISHRLNEVFGLADVFMTGQGSSTIEWGVVSCTPTVVFDWYGFDLNTYEFDLGVFEIKQEEKLLCMTEQLLSDQRFYEDNVLQLMAVRERLSPFDGDCLKRVCENILQK